MKDFLLFILYIAFAGSFVLYLWNAMKNTSSEKRRLLFSYVISLILTAGVVELYDTTVSADRLEENAKFYHVVADDLKESVAIKIIEFGIKPNSIQRVELDSSLTYGTAELDIKGSAVTLEIYRPGSDWLVGCEESGGIFYDFKSYPKVLEKLLDTRGCIATV